MEKFQLITSALVEKYHTKFTLLMVDDEVKLVADTTLFVNGIECLMN